MGLVNLKVVGRSGTGGVLAWVRRMGRDIEIFLF